MTPGGSVDADATDGAPAPVLADAHVHFHPCFRPGDFLDAALENFRGALEPEERTERILGFLLLVDPQGVDTVDRWVEASPDAFGGWHVRSTDESCSIRMSREGAPDLLVAVAGRQIRTDERLEVLAHGTREVIPDGLPFAEALRRARASASVVSIPWGFGKWWFARGNIVRSLVDRGLDADVYLSDNGCRPVWMSGPDRLQREQGASRPVLAGSDPLPFPDHEGRAGSVGFKCRAPVETARPFESLAGHLVKGGSIRTYGRHRRTGRVLADQIRMRLGSGRGPERWTVPDGGASP